MTPKEINLFVSQGSDFSKTFNFTDEEEVPVDLSNINAYAQFKKFHTANTAYDFTVSVNSEMGTITLALTPDATINVEPGRYLYDVVTVSGSNLHSTPIKGIVTINARITQVG
jgi:hypothetical protein